MPAEPKRAVEIFGVRPLVWCGMMMAAASVVLVFRFGEDTVEPRQLSAEVKAKPRVQTNSQASAVPARMHEAGLLVPASESIETVLVGTDVRAAEPVPVLINELFSPDPHARMMAAMRLSRKSVYASEALPVLKKLSRNEHDPRVRELMKEAILNIRGYAPPPFEGAVLKR